MTKNQPQSTEVLRPTERFSDRVADYVRYRPGYPPELLECLRRNCGLKPQWVVADVGSGTGLLAKIFLENGNRVRHRAQYRHAGCRRRIPP